MERMTKKKKEVIKTGMAQTAKVGLSINCKFGRTAELDPRSESSYASTVQWNFSQHHE